MKLRVASLALFVALFGTLVAPLGAAAQVAPNNGPYNVPESPAFNGNGTQVGTFTGTVRNLAFTATKDNRLVVSGILEGTVTRNNGTTETVTQEFRRLLQLPTVSRTCEILTLDIGRIRLDLLGLIVDIAPINIRITAQQGPGNLLGNLLCALVNLLNP